MITTRLAAGAACLALFATPAAALGAGKSDQPHGKAGDPHGQAGTHGNHCGRGHAKHVKGQKGLKIGKTCKKQPHPSSTSDSSSSDSSGS